MTVESELLSFRREYAARRLNELRSSIETSAVLPQMQGLCIYVTGSFGRLEASAHSDLDLFFINEGSSENSRIPRITKTLLDADLINAARTLRFPDFSNDGQYLSVHYVDDIKNTLGGPDDDSRNYFTARLLLLLESRPLYGDEVYERVLRQLIDSYCRDYHDHDKAFHPVFLINDILRFWRTLCLNYERRRNRPTDDEHIRNRNHLVNLKLKFSRLLTCHSAIALLSNPDARCDPDELFDIAQLSPLERLDKIGELKPATASPVLAMKELYSWFLEHTGHEPSPVLAWIADETNRTAAFDNGRQFATQMYNILCKVTVNSDNMRYLVV